MAPSDAGVARANNKVFKHGASKDDPRARIARSTVIGTAVHSLKRRRLLWKFIGYGTRGLPSNHVGIDRKFYHCTASSRSAGDMILVDVNANADRLRQWCPCKRLARRQGRRFGTDGFRLLVSCLYEWKRLNRLARGSERTA